MSLSSTAYAQRLELEDTADHGYVSNLDENECDNKKN